MQVATPPCLGGRYELRRALGRGGMGSVWLARDRRLGRDVAIKVFPVGAAPGTEGRVRFEREARAAAAVAHPNVVTVHDAGVDDGVPYLVMELIGGGTLADVIRQGPIPVGRAIEIACDVLAGLDAAHRRGVLHRDVKPANVLFARGGRAVLADFGIATAGPDDLVPAGMVVGTPGYLSPERLAGGQATVRSDVYGAGVMVYEMLARVRPYHGLDPFALAQAVHQGRARPVHALRGDVGEALSDVVMRAFDRREEARYESAPAFAAALVRARPRPIELGPRRVPAPDRATRRIRPPAPRVGRSPVAAALTAVAMVALWVGMHTGDASRVPEPVPTARTEALDAVPRPVQDAFARLETAVAP